MSGSQYNNQINLPLACNILDPVRAERVVLMCYAFSVCDKGKRNASADDVQWLSSRRTIKSGSLLKNMYAECNVLCSRKAKINVVEASELVL